MSTATKRDYSRLRIIAVLVALVIASLVDHVNSSTFARNSGHGVQTSYSQLDSSACAPCGAPCPSTRE